MRWTRDSSPLCPELTWVSSSELSLLHYNNEVRNEFGFKSVAALGGRSVDPLLAAKSFFYNLIEFYMIGNEALDKVLERCATTHLLSNTSLIGWTGGVTFTLCGASLRYRPNGIPVLCTECRNPGEYVRISEFTQSVKFRCRNVLHPRKYWRIPLLLSDNNRRVIGGLNDQCRYILSQTYI